MNIFEEKFFFKKLLICISAYWPEPADLPQRDSWELWTPRVQALRDTTGQE